MAKTRAATAGGSTPLAGAASQKAERTVRRELGKTTRAENGRRGHAVTGRTKPSGNTVGGHSLKKVSRRGWTEDQIRSSRNHQTRALSKRERRVAAARARDSDPGRG